MLGLVKFARSALLAAGAVFLFAGAAAAGDRYAKECDDQAVLSRIASKFRYQVRNVPHLPDVEISDFRRIHQHRYLPYAENSPIARRYCSAKVELSDGRRRDMWYLIEDRMGFAGVGDGVEFCVSGFDRWYVYNGRCRVLR